MLTISDIRSMANGSSYNKGRELYDANKILDFEVTNGQRVDVIDAVVKGSGRKKYDVTVTYDRERQEIENVACECPAYYEYIGICKHCVAVLLLYRDYQGVHKALYTNSLEESWMLPNEPNEQELLEQLIQLGQIQIGVNEKMKTPATTPILKELLAKQIEKRNLPLLERDIQSQVRIVPLLKIDHGTDISLSFKVGINQLYVVKDIIDFCERINQQVYYSYGQKLQFTHYLQAFKEEDRPLIDLIQKYARRLVIERMHNSYYYAYQSAAKNITLYPEELEELIDVIGERPIIAEIAGQRQTTWQLTEEKLPREMTIEGKENGIEIQLKPLYGIKCKAHYLYFDQGKIYKCNQKEVEPIQDFIECMAYLPDRSAYIGKDDVPMFCRTLLPNLEKFYDCEKKNFEIADYDIVPPTFKIYVDAPKKDWLTCKAEVWYGDQQYSIFEPYEEMGQRDLLQESVLEKMLMSYATSYDALEKQIGIGDEEQIYSLLTEGLDQLRGLAEVYISDKVKRFQIKASPKISVGVALSGDLMELSMISEGVSNQELVELLSQYKQKKRFYRLKNGDFIKVTGEEMDGLMELKKSLQLTDEQMIKGQMAVPKYRALYLDSHLKSYQSLKTSKDKAFREMIRHMKTVEDNDFEIPEGLEPILREYQKRGFLWLKTLKHNGFGGILADDMGLGKTLQVITFLQSEYEEAGEEQTLRTLIVCPASLVFNWKAELEKFAPNLLVKMMTGSTAERKALLENLGQQEIIVTSYDLLKRDIEQYSDLHFNYQIIDEGQYIKNHNTQAAKAVKSIDADFKVALTGTPIENRLSELWSLFDYLMPGFLYPYTRFKEELEQPIVQGKDEVAIKRLQKMIQPFTLRRLKKEVLTDLPDKLEENQYVVLSGEQQKLYDANVQKLKLMLDGQTEEDFKQSKIQILAELTKLRQICCDPNLLYEGYKGDSAKLDLCVELVQNAINGGHKILIFSQFTTMLENIKSRLEKEKISYYLLTGSTSKEKRIQMVETFNQDDTSVFCISLKAGGTGLNLTAADIVIHYDPWWNIAVENQATDRAHRIGQENVVTVYKLIAKDTIEENIVKVQALKKELADQVLTGEGMNTGSFTKEELLELLKSN